jgi:hypothetical protein
MDFMNEAKLEIHFYFNRNQITAKTRLIENTNDSRCQSSKS